LLRWAQFLKRLGHLIPHVFQYSILQLTDAIAAARASGQYRCERCKSSQPGFKHGTGVSPWYAVFIGFSAKAIASALVANHACSVPLDRRQRSCEFNVPPPIQRLPCEGLCISGKSSSPLACGLVALDISGTLGALSSCAVWHAHSRSNKCGNFVYQHFLVATGQDSLRSVRGREDNAF
jgi:hypothetical protein